MAKLSDILKEKGLFSNDIKSRIKNKQLKINGNQISEDIEIHVISFGKNEKDEDIWWIDAGDFLFFEIVPNLIWAKQCFILGFEELFSSDIKNELTKFLNGFFCLRISKKELIILKKDNLSG